MNKPEPDTQATELPNPVPSDAALIQQYVAAHRQDAFAELVHRHLGLVYRSALRQVGDADLAKDVAQTVFTDLARKAASLRDRAVLTGWLYTSTRYAALKARRSQLRRQRRDQETYAMGTEPNDTIDWGRLRPVIDEALHTLSELDRDVLLLRYFDGCSFGNIGARLALAEDTARVRAARGLEKLARALRTRGVTSTSAALALALEAEAAATVPAGLATQVTSTALATAAVSAGAALFSGFATKVAIALAAVAATGGTVAIHQSIARRQIETELAASEHLRAALHAELRSTQARLTAVTQRAAAESADTATLLAAISSSRAASATVRRSEPAADAAPITADAVQARYTHAQQLEREGNWAEALREYLWCFDEGMVRIGSFAGVRRSFLTSELGRLAQKFPEARAAIEARIATAEQALKTSPSNHDAAADYAALNHALDRDDRTLAAYDELSPDDPRRRSLAGVYLYDSFVTARRYADAVQSRPYESSVRTFTTMVDQVNNGRMPAAGTPSLRRSIVANAAKSVEALAGAGDLQQAREFAGKILAFDSTAETRLLLQTHATRAGHPEVIEPLPAP